MKAPVIFLAFANENPPLDSLTKEKEDIIDALETGQANAFYRVHTEDPAKIDRVTEKLTGFDNQVAIFHYAGHAESKKLLLADQEANSDGIANLLKLQENLQLVFLNGCSTKAQVTLLLESGIPVVIATSEPIEDRTAGIFAKQFYLALAKGSTIENAFETASANAQAKGGDKPKVHRGMGFPEDTESKDILPWGLYALEDDKKALQWKMPAKSTKEFIIRGASNRYNVSKVPVNETLTKDLMQEMANYSDELEFLKMKMDKGDKVDLRKIRRYVMDALPAPIGEQVRKLFAADPETQNSGLDKISVERLRQLVTTYNTILELVAFTMLAQLWDTRVQKPELKMKQEGLDTLKAYFNLKPEDLPLYNYAEIIRAIREFFDEHKEPLFIEELKELREKFEKEESFSGAIMFMEDMKKELFAEGSQVAADEIESFCVQAEEQLGEIFKNLGFIAKYHLTTIKNIDLIKKRHHEPRYVHNFVKLDTITAGYADDVYTYDKFVDNKSVVFLKSDEEVEDYLNLSPFVIDENAFTEADKSKLFFFTHYEKASNTFNYKFAYINEDRLNVNQDWYQEIKEEFDSFGETVFGKKMQEL